MDDYKKLAQSTVFKFAFYFPIFVGVVLSLVIMYNNPDYPPCWSSECFNNFFELYKYPISVAGLSIPLCAIAAAVHRSEETSRQISLTQSQLNETLTQNKFSNYIKHKEDFLELLGNMESVCKCKFTDPIGIYNKIFPKNNYLSLDFKAHPKSDTQRSNKLLETLQQDLWSAETVLFEPAPSENQYVALIVDLHGLTEQLQLNHHEQSDSKLTWPENFADTSYKNLQYIVNGLVSFSSFKASDKTAFEEAWRLRRAENSWSAYNRNVQEINRMMKEVDVDLAFS